MNQTMQERFSIPKTPDIFVADILRHVSQKYNAPQCAILKVKVAHCRTRESWIGLWSLARHTVDRKRLAERKGQIQQSPDSTWRTARPWFGGEKREPDDGSINCHLHSSR